jgi:hypothetical protein
LVHCPDSDVQQWRGSVALSQRSRSQNNGVLQMKSKGLMVVWALVAVLSSGCEQNKSPIDKAVDGTKDALNMREHEKLKDAGEDAPKAVQDAADGVKDAVNGKD